MSRLLAAVLVYLSLLAGSTVVLLVAVVVRLWISGETVSADNVVRVDFRAAAERRKAGRR